MDIPTFVLLMNFAIDLGEFPVFVCLIHLITVKRKEVRTAVRGF